MTLRSPGGMGGGGRGGPGVGGRTGRRAAAVADPSDAGGVARRRPGATAPAGARGGPRYPTTSRRADRARPQDHRLAPGRCRGARPDDVPVLVNPAARAMGLLRTGATPGSIAAHPLIRTLAGQVRRTGVRREIELDLPRGRDNAGENPLGVHLRAMGLGGGYIAVEAADVTESHRLARVRRDFVANVSHELKTPIGALQLLAEALLDATEPADAGARPLRGPGGRPPVRRADPARVDPARPAGAGVAGADPAAGRRAAARAGAGRGRLGDRRGGRPDPHRGRRPRRRGGRRRAAGADRRTAATASSPPRWRTWWRTPSTTPARTPRSGSPSAARRRARRDRRHRPGHRHRPHRRRPDLRAVLPGRPGPLPRHRRHRPRPGHRQTHRQQPWRPGRGVEHSWWGVDVHPPAARPPAGRPPGDYCRRLGSSPARPSCGRSDRRKGNTR